MSANTKTYIKSRYFFGWNLLYKTVENIVNKKEDLLVILLHFQLTKHSNFRCIGLGEDETILNDDKGSELLPDGWNNDRDIYALRYICNEKLCLLHAQKTKHCLVINLIDPKTKEKGSTNISLNAENLVQLKTDCFNLDDLVPTASEIVDRYRKELIEPFNLSTATIVSKKDVGIQATEGEIVNKKKDILVDDIRPERERKFVTESWGIRDNTVSDLYPVGRFGIRDGSSDMYPLGHFGIDNIFPPTRANNRGPYNPYNEYDSFDLI